MSVSVLMSVFNGETYLASAIESVLRQTHKDFEFIIIDDGSTDRSPAIIRSYAHRDARIVAVSQANRGLPAALNVGLGIAKYDLVARLDADDRMVPTRLERQLWFLSHHPRVSVACSNVNFIDRAGRIIGISKPRVDVGRGRRTGIARYFVEFAHPSVIMRRSDILAFRGYNEEYRFAQDRELWGRLVTGGCRIEVQHEFLLEQRLHYSSMTMRDIAGNHSECEYIDLNFARRARGEAEWSREQFRQLKARRPFYQVISEKLELASLALYTKATRHLAERRWVGFTSCLALALGINPISVMRRILTKIDWSAR